MLGEGKKKASLYNSLLVEYFDNETSFKPLWKLRERKVY